MAPTGWGARLSRVLLVLGGVSLVATGWLMSTLTFAGGDFSQVCGYGSTCAVFAVADWGRIVLAGILLCLGAIPRGRLWVVAVVGWAWGFVGYLPDSLQVYEPLVVPSNAVPTLAAALFGPLLVLGMIFATLGLFGLWVSSWPPRHRLIGPPRRRPGDPHSREGEGRSEDQNVPPIGAPRL